MCMCGSSQSETGDFSVTDSISLVSRMISTSRLAFIGSRMTLSRNSGSTASCAQLNFRWNSAKVISSTLLHSDSTRSGTMLRM